LILGGVVVCFVSIKNLGGWEQLYIKTPEKMHLHLSSDHPTLPWTHLFGLFFLNINYWCANQTIMQRALAAKNIKHAQVGLIAGGFIKYIMAIIIIIPGIALYGEIGDSLTEPDLAFPYMIKTFLPVGLKGIILCGLFASLMSTVDSTFNSLGTLWSTDIYSKYINKRATDTEKINAGRNAILFSLGSALITGFILLYLKFNDPSSAFTHTLNNLRYYINCGIVVLICSAVTLYKPNRKWILWAFILTVPLNIFLQNFYPDLNYFVRAFYVIIAGLFVAITSSSFRLSNLITLFYGANNKVRYFGWLLLFSLIALHIIFH
jgi:SSS family solute:Na+ symporter